MGISRALAAASGRFAGPMDARAQSSERGFKRERLRGVFCLPCASVCTFLRAVLLFVCLFWGFGDATVPVPRPRPWHHLDGLLPSAGTAMMTPPRTLFSCLLSAHRVCWKTQCLRTAKRPSLALHTPVATPACPIRALAHTPCMQHPPAVVIELPPSTMQRACDGRSHRA